MNKLLNKCLCIFNLMKKIFVDKDFIKTEDLYDNFSNQKLITSKKRFNRLYIDYKKTHSILFFTIVPIQFKGEKDGTFHYFLLDTGSDSNIINERFSKEIENEESKEADTHLIVGVTGEVNQVISSKFKFKIFSKNTKNISFWSDDFVIMKLQQFEDYKEYGIDIEGILGINFLNKINAIFDLKHYIISCDVKIK